MIKESEKQFLNLIASYFKTYAETCCNGMSKEEAIEFTVNQFVEKFKTVNYASLKNILEDIHEIARNT